jgi:hypothetical protein
MFIGEVGNDIVYEVNYLVHDNMQETSKTSDTTFIDKLLKLYWS